MEKIKLDSKANVQKLLARIRELTPTLGHAEVIAYKNWEDPNGFREVPNKVKAEFDLSQGYSFKGFTQEELLKVHRFGNWDGNIILLPLYLYPYLPIGTTLIDVTGKPIEVKPNYLDLDYSDSGYIDADHRGGFIAFGFSKDALTLDDSLT